MKNVYIGLGSNLENPENQIESALQHINEISETHLERVSSLYKSTPMGPQDQPDFLNAVALVKTSKKPLELLAELQAIEHRQKRVREEHWGPRTIDLDILLFGDEVIDYPELVIPHPGLTQRAFVLCPLFEIAPALILPSGERLSDLLIGIECLSTVT